MAICQYVGFDDAKAVVSNSGVLDWDWGNGRDSTAILDALARYLYDNSLDFDDIALGRFIRDILHDDPGEFEVLHPEAYGFLGAEDSAPSLADIDGDDN